jgi:hypothetical protein
MRRGLGQRNTAAPSPGTVSADSGMRTRTPGSATAGSPIAITPRIRAEPAAACHRANMPPSEWPITGTWFVIQGLLLALAGHWFARTAARRRRWTLSLAAGLLAAMTCLRGYSAGCRERVGEGRRPSM